MESDSTELGLDELPNMLENFAFHLHNFIHKLDEFSEFNSM